MGMFNEVFAPCPKCGKQAYMQVPQVVLGFGGFYLDNPSTMEELTVEQLHKLRGYVVSRYFRCEMDPVEAAEAVLEEMRGGTPTRSGCGYTFNPLHPEPGESGKIEFIRKLFSAGD